MKKIIILCLALLLFPFPVDGQDGAYNLTSRLAWCQTRAACVHEVGHAMDQQADWISASPEFYKALQMYLYSEIYTKGVTELPASILEITYRGDGASVPIKREVYAFLFQYVDGDIDKLPESLRIYFDRTQAEYLLNKLQDNQRFYWLN